MENTENIENMENTENIENKNDMFAIYNSSELLQNLLEDENKINITENKITEILQNEINRLDIKICFNTCIKYLISLVTDYKTINYDNTNIFMFVKLSTYFLLNNTYEFIEYIATEHILKKQMFYQELCNFGTINSMLEHVINNNMISVNFKIMEYIHTHNFDIFKNIISLGIYDEYDIATNILKNFSNLIELNIYFNGQIDLNFLTKLQILDMTDCLLIYDDNISKLTELKVLTVSNCPNITNVNIFEKLVYLDISEKCGVDQSGIENLMNVKILNVYLNKKITDVSHLKKLVEIITTEQFTCDIPCPYLFNNNINIYEKMDFFDEKFRNYYFGVDECGYDDYRNYIDYDNYDENHINMPAKEKLKYYQIEL